MLESEHSPDLGRSISRVRSDPEARARARQHASLAWLFVLWPAAMMHAQSTLSGTVLSGGGNRAALTAAEVQAARLRLRAVTDSVGRFRLPGIPAGEHLFTIRAAGHEPDSFVVDFAENESVTKDFVLRPRVTRLSEVEVKAASQSLFAGLSGFEGRRRLGVGHFLDRAAIARWENRRTSDMIAMVPGADVRRGIGSKAWAVSGRAVGPGKCAFCRDSKASILDEADIAAGAGVACYMDVYLDGALIYSSASRKVPLFDLNSLSVSEIEAVELYASAAQIPAQFNRTSGGCGVLLIWTRVS